MREKNTLMGSYYPDLNYIELSKSNKFNANVSTILHEGVHAYQNNVIKGNPLEYGIYARAIDIYSGEYTGPSYRGPAKHRYRFIEFLSPLEREATNMGTAVEKGLPLKVEKQEKK